MKIQLVKSSAENHLFEKADTLTAETMQNPLVLEILPEHVQKGHPIVGFGASFTDAAAYLVDQVLSDEDKKQAMVRLFDSSEGIGLSLIRNPMGASDYARKIYSYDDQAEGETDPQLEEFSIRHDEESIIPLTRWAKDLNPNLQIFASPWSAPGWMKDTRKMVTGKLLSEYYDVYAQYFVKFIKSYGEHGLSIAGVTPQNEPLFVPKNYPGMEMLAQEQVTFVQKFLKPAFKEAGLETKIYGYDHNWDRPDYPLTLLDEAAESFDGIAWHWYGGHAINQERVATAYPDKEIHFTEGSGGEWIPEFEPAFSNLIRTGIDILRYGSQSMILWNIALDENNGPTVPGFGRSTCRGLLKINQKTAKFDYTLDYFGLAHFSKFIKPRANRISTEVTEKIRNVAFLNEDGSISVVLFNNSEESQDVRLQIADTDFGVRLAAKEAASVLVEL